MSLQYMFTVHVHMHNHTYMPYVWPHGESFCFKLPDSRTGLRVRACVRAYVVVRACVLHACMCACVRAYVCVDHTVISVHVLSYTSSGLTEDRLAIRVSFVNNESFHFCVAKPSEWKWWVPCGLSTARMWMITSLPPSLPSHPDGGQRSNPVSAIIQGRRVGLYCDVAS